MDFSIKPSNRLKTILIFSLAAAIPFIIILLVYKEMGIAPFGQRSILIMDMSDQYVAFFAELRNIVQGKSSIFFSWNKSFGCNFIGVFAYYISSPLSLFTLFFSPEDLPIALMWLTCIKIGLAGLSITVYFKYAFNKCGIITLILATCYALMSYTSAYSLSLMWLDGLIWLPVILLGVEKLLIGRFPWILTVGFHMMFISNYYISYMIGIFSVLYFLLRYFGEKRQYKKELIYFLKFGISVLLAAGLASWLLIPTAFDLFTGKLSSGMAAGSSGTYFTLKEFLLKLLPGQYDTITTSGRPSIFCGTVVLFFSGIYFLNTKINRRERLLSLFILLFLMISMFSKKMDFMWHGFQYPVWFPFRYAFLFSFFLIFLSFRAIYSLPLSKWLEKYPVNKNKNNYYIITYSLVMIIFCFEIYEIYGNCKTIISGLDQEFHYQSLESYQDIYQVVMPLVAETHESQEFFRVEKNFERSKNDAMIFGYHGITHYSSAYHSQINWFTRKIGLAQTHFWNSYYGNTPLTDMLFDVKYMMSRTPMPSSAYITRQENEGVTLFEGRYILPAAYMAKNVSVFEASLFEGQNQLLNKISGLNYHYFEACAVESIGYNRYSFTSVKNGPYYLYVPAELGAGAGNIFVNDVFVSNYFTSETLCILYIGEYQAGETVTVFVDSDINADGINICSLDMERLQEAYESLKAGGLKDVEYGRQSIAGRADAAEDGTMLTSIPYDEGFRIYVDGKRVEKAIAFDVFLSFPVPEGEHWIRIEYAAPGLAAGIIVMCISLLAGVVFTVRDNKRRAGRGSLQKQKGNAIIL